MRQLCADEVLVVREAASRIAMAISNVVQEGKEKTPKSTASGDASSSCLWSKMHLRGSNGVAGSVPARQPGAAGWANSLHFLRVLAGTAREGEKLTRDAAKAISTC